MTGRQRSHLSSGLAFCPSPAVAFVYAKLILGRAPTLAEWESLGFHHSSYPQAA